MHSILRLCLQSNRNKVLFNHVQVHMYSMVIASLMDVGYNYDRHSGTIYGSF